jgi:hypothetical protein
MREKLLWRLDRHGTVQSSHVGYELVFLGPNRRQGMPIPKCQGQLGAKAFARDYLQELDLDLRVWASSDKVGWNGCIDKFLGKPTWEDRVIEFCSVEGLIGIGRLHSRLREDDSEFQRRGNSWLGARRNPVRRSGFHPRRTSRSRSSPTPTRSSPAFGFE